MRALVPLLALLAGIPTPGPPTLAESCPPFNGVVDKVIELNPVVYADPANNADQPGRRLLPDGSAEYMFTSISECSEPLAELEPEDPANFAPAPPIEPGYDEHGPGPPEGPPGATPVDKPE